MDLAPIADLSVDIKEDAGTDELTRLKAQLASTEAERDALASENAELRFFQQMASAISALRESQDIVDMLLRYICEILIFERAVFFHVDADGIVRRDLERRPNGEIIPAEDGAGFRSDSAIAFVADGRTPIAVGHASDDDRPLEDSQGAYCLVPLTTRGKVHGLLYADSEFLIEISERQTSLMSFFAGQAATAIENARLYQETQDLALRDPLTGIANRRALEDQLERELHVARRSGKHLAYAIIDVDNFKKINDTGGHQAGDEALKSFADCLQRGSRKGDIVARFAGDEFVVVMLDTTPERARQGIERIQSELWKSGLKSSIGLALFPTDAEDADALQRAADQALYVAKERGKNQFRFFGE